jgi:regulator of sirC expression with transglutaminase-like and TPR domain
VAPKTTDRLHQIICGPEQEINLAEGALAIASHAYAELDITGYLARLDKLGGDLNSRLGPDSTTAERLRGLNDYLFFELGFGPNSENYYDPRNSFLNEVLERRLGIPITLSLLYMEIGQRIGLELHGISFPGHFLVKCAMADGVVVLDPYSRGVSLSMTDLQDRLREHQGGEVSRAIVAGLLVAAGKKDILGRMLRNLKNIYMQSGESGRALPMLDAILAMTPDAASDLRDRGLVYQQLECVRAAAVDLQRYLDSSPDAADADDVRLRLMDLRRQCASLH